MEKTDERAVMDLATLAGHVLLENGAEITRVEDSMERIVSYYGVDSRNFFVLSNGIFTTGSSHYAKVEFIPFKGAQLGRVVAVNQICRDIQNGKYTVEEAREAVQRVRNMPAKRWYMQLAGSAVGSAGFCMIFGGGLLDSAAAFTVGLLLWLFVMFVSSPYLSKITGNILGGVLATALCILFHRIGFGVNLGNMVIGSIIPLIPGIPFTNGIRDIVDQNYIAGSTRMMDALLVFFCIAIGVSVSFLADGWAMGAIIELDGTTTDPITSTLAMQIVAAFFGTVGFAVLFGVPSKYYMHAGLVATTGWVVYLLLMWHSQLGVTIATFCSAVVVVMLSRWLAGLAKTPATLFIVCGIFPSVPGGGLFWTTYYVISDQLTKAFTSGFTSVKVSIAIALAIVLVGELPQRLFVYNKSKQ